VVFSSSVFIFIFLPIALLGYYLLSLIKQEWGIRVQRLFLVIVSIVFYGYFKIEYAKIIVISIVINYGCALICQKYAKTRIGFVFFILGVLFNVLLLGYYKYFDFLRDTLNHITGSSFEYLNILLPLGISFFTFQQLSFLVSVQKREERVAGFINYSLFVTFFPQLVAGPIVTYSEMMPQFEDMSLRKFNFDNMSRGIYIFIIGLTKKLVIADTLALFVSNGYNLNTYGLAAAWLTSLAYTMQIYFDFSGYSDMAIGLGNMFNIKLPMNFNSPYKSASIQEFWGRWHMTLGRALSTFIYIPLGGNRKGLARTYFNLMVTFFISGLWHGASWTFVVWGCLHGIVNVLERVFKRGLNRIPRILRVAGTFLFVNAACVFFRAPTFGKALAILKGMASFQSLRISQVNQIVYDGIFTYPLSINLLYIGSLLAILLFIVFFTINSVEYLQKFTSTVGNLLISCALFVVSVIHLSRLSTFIYFNF